MTLHHRFAYLALSGTVLVACGGSSSNSAADYGVAPWSGPPTNFVGTWVTSEVRDQSGAVLAGGNGFIKVLPGFESGSTLTIFGLSVGAPSEPPCLGAFLDQTSVSATITPDGHGFDATTIVTGEPYAAHARVDSTGQMHVELDTTGAQIVNSSDTITSTCSDTFTFIATMSVDGGL